MTASWEIPAFDTQFALARRHAACVVIPVINEGPRIRSLLERMAASGIPAYADIVVVDGGSTDGSVEETNLRAMDVRAWLVKTGPGKLSAQLRCAYSYALTMGYEKVVTIDGNDRDDPQGIPRFLDALDQGADFVQASRFLPGGKGENTPLVREFALRLLHAPLLSWFSGFHWTDTTQGFRAYRREVLVDPRVAPFRDTFSDYELLAYLSYRVPRLGYRCIELPTVRRYPPGEFTTKISGFRGNVALLRALVMACAGQYNPK